MLRRKSTKPPSTPTADDAAISRRRGKSVFVRFTRARRSSAAPSPTPYLPTPALTNGTSRSLQIDTTHGPQAGASRRKSLWRLSSPFNNKSAKPNDKPSKKSAPTTPQQPVTDAAVPEWHNLSTTAISHKLNQSTFYDMGCEVVFHRKVVKSKAASSVAAADASSMLINRTQLIVITKASASTDWGTLQLHRIKSRSDDLSMVDLRLSVELKALRSVGSIKPSATELFGGELALKWVQKGAHSFRFLCLSQADAAVLAVTLVRLCGECLNVRVETGLSDKVLAAITQDEVLAREVEKSCTIFTTLHTVPSMSGGALPLASSSAAVDGGHVRNNVHDLNVKKGGEANAYKSVAFKVNEREKSNDTHQKSHGVKTSNGYRVGGKQEANDEEQEEETDSIVLLDGEVPSLVREGNGFKWGHEVTSGHRNSVFSNDNKKSNTTENSNNNSSSRAWFHMTLKEARQVHNILNQSEHVLLEEDDEEDYDPCTLPERLHVLAGKYEAELLDNLEQWEAARMRGEIENNPNNHSRSGQLSAMFHLDGIGLSGGGSQSINASNKRGKQRGDSIDLMITQLDEVEVQLDQLDKWMGDHNAALRDMKLGVHKIARENSKLRIESTNHVRLRHVLENLLLRYTVDADSEELVGEMESCLVQVQEELENQSGRNGYINGHLSGYNGYDDKNGRVRLPAHVRLQRACYTLRAALVGRHTVDLFAKLDVEHLDDEDDEEDIGGIDDDVNSVSCYEPENNMKLGRTQGGEQASTKQQQQANGLDGKNINNNASHSNMNHVENDNHNEEEEELFLSDEDEFGLGDSEDDVMSEMGESQDSAYMYDDEEEDIDDDQRLGMKDEQRIEDRLQESILMQHESTLLAVQERQNQISQAIYLLGSHLDMFLESRIHFHATQLSEQLQLQRSGLADAPTINGLPKLRSCTQVHERLGAYVSLARHLRVLDVTQFEQVVVAYVKDVGQLYGYELSGFFTGMERLVESSTHLDSRLSAMQLCSIHGFAAESAAARVAVEKELGIGAAAHAPNPAVALRYSLEQVIPALANEQEFLRRLFRNPRGHDRMEQLWTGNARGGGGSSSKVAIAQAVMSKREQRERDVDDVRVAMERMFCVQRCDVVAGLNRFVKRVSSSSSNFEMLNMVVDVEAVVQERHNSDSTDFVVDILTNPQNGLQASLQVTFSSFVDHQLKWIDSQRPDARCCGVLIPVRKFPAFIDQILAVWDTCRTAAAAATQAATAQRNGQSDSSTRYNGQSNGTSHNGSQRIGRTQSRRSSIQTNKSGGGGQGNNLPSLTTERETRIDENNEQQQQHVNAWESADFAGNSVGMALQKLATTLLQWVSRVALSRPKYEHLVHMENLYFFFHSVGARSCAALSRFVDQAEHDFVHERALYVRASVWREFPGLVAFLEHVDEIIGGFVNEDDLIYHKPKMEFLKVTRTLDLGSIKQRILAIRARLTKQLSKETGLADVVPPLVASFLVENLQRFMHIARVSYSTNLDIDLEQVKVFVAGELVGGGGTGRN